jgi:hypothetical protein
VVDVVQGNRAPADKFGADAGFEIPGYAAINWLKSPCVARWRAQELHLVLARALEEPFRTVHWINIAMIVLVGLLRANVRAK